MKKFLSVFLSFALGISAFLGVSVQAFAAYTSTIKAFTYNGYSIPAYDGDKYEVINSNKPKFKSSQLTQNIYEKYGKLDSLGRVTTCEANIDQSLMPKGSRGNISSVYPTGWVQNSYSFVSGKYLYNRSHIIGWQLTGENANKQNLMTGTRTFNADGMLEFENKVAKYVKQNKNNNVLYRVTPVFQGDNLLASGVIMEAESVDDYGKSVMFCVFVYNVENGVSIDYATGNNKAVSSTSATCPKGHKYESYVAKKATTAADGEVVSQCSVCSHKEKKIIKSIKSIKLSYTACTYSNEYKKPKVTVTDRSGNTIPSKYYTLRYSNNKGIGKASVKITFKGKYSGSATRSFTIRPRNTSVTQLNAKSKGFYVKWKRQTIQTTGYQIRYSLSSDFSNAQTKTITKNTTLSTTVSKLKGGKRYYVQIRTYKSVNGKRFYSPWGKTSSVVTKR